jgi:hypothetical protein
MPAWRKFCRSRTGECGSAPKGHVLRRKGRPRDPIDYVVAVNGGLRFVPAGAGLKALEEDYAHMVGDGLVLEDAEPFEAHGALPRHRRAGQRRRKTPPPLPRRIPDGRRFAS